jgi:uncharacterized repeat protein (TIGR03833 family)
LSGKIQESGEEIRLDGTIRSNIRIGALVDVVLKKDQPTGKLTRGHVKRILTNSPTHPRGIKVMLEEEDLVGRVRNILA